MELTEERFIEILDTRLNAVDQRFIEILDTRFTAVDQRFIEILDTRFNAIDQRFLSIDKRFDSVEGRLDTHEGIFVTMVNRLDHVDQEVADVKHRVSGMEITLEDVQEELHALSAAFDNDAETMVEHGQRISTLEKNFA